jgi:hypothetical protein
MAKQVKKTLVCRHPTGSDETGSRLRIISLAFATGIPPAPCARSTAAAALTREATMRAVSRAFKLQLRLRVRAALRSSCRLHCKEERHFQATCRRHGRALQSAQRQHASCCPR